MKKYVLAAGLAGLVACGLYGAWLAAALLFAGLFAWIAWETRQRERPRFLSRADGLKETAFRLGAELGEMALSPDGGFMLLALKDHSLSMRDATGRELWWRPMEPKTLAIAALPRGRACFALPSELCLCDEKGFVERRLAFEAPPFIQSYHLLASADGSLLCLHTPWFLQFFPADLSALGQRISSEETGHYMKYASLSDDGRTVAAAGARLLEEEQTTEARWCLWRREDEGWRLKWKGSEESYMNSHLRGISLSGDGQRLFLELHRSGYEVRAYGADSAELLKSPGEHPAPSPDGSLLAWETPFDGILVKEVVGGAKRLQWKASSELRVKLFSGKRLWVLDRHALRGLSLDNGPELSAALGSQPDWLGAFPRLERLGLAKGRNFSIVEFRS